MEKGITDKTKNEESALRTLETDLGEPVLYRATARFLGSGDLGAVPLDSWGLVALTPTRLVFHRFAQAHPLFGGKGEEVRWEVARGRFDACAPVLHSFWNKLFSGAPDHVSLTGPGVHLSLETADDQRRLPEAWNNTAAGAPLDPAPGKTP